ncbi:MAG: hypothetical protein N2322_06465, partial [Terrimicrobiaceae bacterium]|nr:hypothetical protein [Terrimicrobiaceae bacterium]
MESHTHTHGNFRLRYGHPLPMGASLVAGGVNFSIFSMHATSCTLVLFQKGAPEPFAEIPIPPEFRLGNVWAMAVLDVDPSAIEYGYRFDGPRDPREGHLFNPQIIVTDPYARELSGDGLWRGPRH